MTLDYEGIAVIGMAGRFPGAESVEEFWANLVAGKDTVSFFSDAELTESGLNAEELRRNGRYVPARGILANADCFDAAFFGVHPKEAEVIEPQQRVFLEICWAALERAGYAPNRLSAVTGVFAGSSRNSYFLHALHQRPDLLELIGPEMVMFGNEKDYLTTRVAYKLGLKGPALNVSTACSSSLVAVAQAVQSLLTYQCDIGLAGGVSVMVPQKRGYYFDEGNIGSYDGHTRTFDAQAAGTVFSNGVAVVVLKRLADAVKDGDQIYAVIKGAALNNDGSQRVSFGAPGVEGQAEVIAMAHALAGIEPDTITCVEAHGTATLLGDPIEIAGLTKAFRLGTDAKQFCAIGSVKSNIGHLDVAAGAAGLIKMALSLHHKIIPASLHFTAPNPKLNLEDSPFYVNASLQEWKAKRGVPRRGGVSSFGTGGTNAHVVLEEAPELPPSGPSRPWQLLPLSAKTPEALDRATANLSEYLKSLAQQGNPEQTHTQQLADTAFTLQTGRSEFNHRRIVVVQDAAEGAAVLDARGAKRVFTHNQQLNHPPVVFMFPGQGAQYAGMGAELYRTEPVFRDTVDRCADILQLILNRDIRAIIFPADATEKAQEEAEELLVQTRFTQPALFVIEYALAQLWMSWGIRPASMIGHSVGEYVAACLAGVFSLQDALSLVARRGAIVQSLPGGSMLVVRAPEKDVAPLLNGDLTIAAVNSPGLCVVAGPYSAVETLEKEFESRKIATRHLPTSHAFHSPMMEPALAPFAELLRQVRFSDPQIPFVSNVTGKWVTPDQAKSVDYWAGHLRQTVRFADGIGELLKDSRNLLLEVGPGQTLSTLARQHPAKSAEQAILASLPFAGALEGRGILESLGRLWMAGVEIDWRGFYANETRHRTTLPSYPFERTRYYAAPPAVAAPPSTVSAVPGAVAPNPSPSETSVPVPAPQQAGAISQSAAPRKERLLAAARSLLQDLSGSDLSGVDTSSNLLELGLDSLLLTQASHLFQKKFGVAISFRQLMEELSSLDDIAAYLDAKLPPDKFAAPVSAPAQAAALPAAASSPTLNAVTGDTRSVLEQLLLQQQNLTNQVLQMLGRTPAPTVSEPLASAASTPPSAHAPTPERSSTASAASMKSHGPFKPIDRSAGTLTVRQAKALDELIARYTRRTAESKKLAAQNRPVLADPRSVAGFNRLWKEMVYPISTIRSDGSRVWDVDGNEYVDFVMGFGASMFGHRPPFVVRAVEEQLKLGFEIGPIQPLAGEVAALLREFTGMERVGFTNTGSEAVLAATRVARTVTGRDKIAVFAGAYHGIFDEVLFRPLKKNGQAAPIAPGIPSSALDEVIVLDYGNPESLDIIRARGSEIAAVLVEPVQSRRLDLQPREFLHELRRVTEQTGSALIFDEVVTGFRLQPGGAQAYFDVRADLATYGKVIGGGLPIGAVTGSPKYMDALDGGQWQYGDTSFPEVGVTFFAGTFVRHPLSLAAAKAVLTHLKEAGPQLQQRLASRAVRAANDMRAVLAEFEAPYKITQFTSLIQLGLPHDQKFAALLFYYLREHGIHIWENRAFVLTTAHSEEDFSRFNAALRASLAEMRDGEFLPPPYGSSGKTHTPSNGHRIESETLEPLAPVAVAQDSLETEFPLTEAQTEIWLAAQMSTDAAIAYNESLSLDFIGAFDTQIFRAAVRQILQRHPILLASISADGHAQRVQPGTKVEIPLINLANRPASERQAELEKLIDDETRQPFNLATGPLLRVKIVRLSPDRHVVIWTAHHMICDGWSGGLLIDELAQIYSAGRKRAAPALDAPLSFRKYVEANGFETAGAKTAVAYWSDQYKELPAPLDLPTDHSRPALRSSRARTTKRNIDSSLHKSLKRVAGQQRTTLVVLLMAGLKTLLYRLTGQENIVVGLGAAGQAMTGDTCLVGHCLNLLPIRTHLHGDASFQENLAAVKKSVLDAYDHYECTLGTLLQHLSIPRNPGRSPLVEVLFNLDKDPGSSEFSGLKFNCGRNPKRALHFDLFFNFVEGPSDLVLECDYNSDLFEQSTIDRWLGYFETLLAGMATSPAEVLGKLPILTAQERKEITVDWNSTEVQYPLDGCLFEFIEQQVERTPDAPALAFEGETLSYRQLNARTNQLAHYLRGRGVGPEKLVAVVAERSLEMVVALLGIIKAGGAYVPIDPWNPEERLALLLGEVQGPVVLTQQRFASRLPKSCAALALDRPWREISSRPQTNPERLTNSGNAVYVIYTSGSTGLPKGVINIHRGIVNRLLWMQDAFQIGPNDRALQKTPFTFDVSVWEFFWPLMTGACLVMARPEGHKDPDYLVSTIASERITTLHFVPSMLEVFLDARGVESLASIERVICSGEALTTAAQQRFFERLPKAELHNLYGPTEAAVDVTHWPCRKGSQFSTVPIGKPIANTQIYVLDSYMNPTPIGVSGELHIGGVQVARGYLNRPELTAERFIADPFSSRQISSQQISSQPDARLYKTGDLVRYLSDGNIEYLGRADHQVKIRGFRIELGEIEAALQRLDSVRECVAVAREDEPGQKQLVAYIVPKTGAMPDAESLRRHLKQSLPDYMVPSSFVLLEKFPLTSSGKINRKSLPLPSSGTAPSARNFVEPRSEREKALAAIWCEILKLPKVGIESNFFDIGGHSLLAIRVVSRIRDQFQVDLSPRIFFANATIAALAQIIDQEIAQTKSAGIQKIPRRQGTGPSPLSFAQERLWFLDQLASGSPVYNIVDIIEFAHVSDASLIKRAFAELVNRHEILRTAFSESEGDPVQMAQPSIELSLREVDLSALPAAEKEFVWTRIAREQGRKAFDLAKPPLFRATLAHLGQQEYLLLLALHHIVADEWSMEVLHRDLHRIYGALAQQRPAPLLPLPIQYADFAAWQREFLTGEILDRQASYWKAQLAGAPTVLDLATDKPRPAVQSFRGAAMSMKFSVELSEPVRALAREEKATLFMIFMAAFMALVNRYTGQPDILVGSPISGRTLSETEELVGFFLNTIVLRGQFDDNVSFRSLLRQVREKALGAYAHQDFPFGNLVAELSPDRDPSHSPLIQVMFILQNAEAVSQASRLAGIQKLETGTSKFDLTLFMSETPEGFEGLIEYSTDLFQPATIQRLLKNYETLLESIARNPDESVAALPLLAADERRHLVEELNQTAVSYAEKDYGLHQLFEIQAKKTPNRVAVSFESRQISYRELDERANQLANYLKTCGVGAESLVGVLLERSSEMVVALLAILKAGGAYVPLDPSFPRNRIAHMVEDSRIRVLLTHRRLDDTLAVRPEIVVRLDSDAGKIAKESRVLAPFKVNAGQLAYVLYTSGSTGKPKGVEISHSAIVNFLLSMRGEPGFSSDDILLAVTTLSFDIAGLELYLPLITGGKLVIATREETHDPARLMQRLRESACTVMQATPATWRSLIDAGWNGSPRLKILCGGEAFPAELAVQLLPRCAELWNMYGPTETTVWSTVHKVADVADSVPIGHPIGNTQVFVLDAHRYLLPQGAIGELYIGGAGVANGYLRRDELTRERFIESPFESHARLYRTGDLARWLPDGSLECLGRVDNQVKIRGFRIELGEIEAVLSRHEAIAQGVVAARDSGNGDKILVAYFEARPGSSPDITDLRNHLKKDLPDYMIPSAFVRMEKLPLTANGKIDRKALPSPEHTRIDVGGQFIAPRDGTEQTLAQLWSKVLKVDRVGASDDFFALGGHSLLALRIIVEIEKQFKRRLPLATLLQSPTVADLADVLRMPEKSPSWSSLVRIKAGGSRPPLFLMHSHGGNVLEYYPLANLLDPDQPVYGVQALGLDGRIQKSQSIEKIIAIYLQEIRTLQPRGPYLLGGFCFGGLLALEAARQLTAAGEDVSAVVLLQTMHPDAAQFGSNTTRFQRAWYRAAKRIDLERENLAYRGSSYLHERFDYGFAKAWARTAIALDKVRGNGTETGGASKKTRPMPYILESLTREHDRMAEQYQVRPYRGNVILFRAAKQLTGLVADQSLGWKNVITGNLDICEIPGHQQNILTEPNVIHLASELSARLRRLFQSVAAD